MEGSFFNNYNMKKIYIVFSVISLVIVLTYLLCCEHSDEPVNEYSKDVRHIQVLELPEQDLLFTNGEPDSCVFVKLETNKECLMGHIKKMIVCDTLIFIKDYHRQLFVFNTKGKFLNEIGRIGYARNEILHLTDFYVDEQEKRVCIYDAYKKVFSVYSFDGELIQVKSCDNFKFMEAMDICLLPDRKILLTMSYREDIDYSYFSIDEDNYSEEKGLLPCLFKSKEPGRSGNLPQVVTTNNKLYTPRIFSEVIYSYRNSGYSPAFIVNTGLKNVNKKVMKKYSSYENTAEVRKALRENGYFMGLNQIFATERYLRFSLVYDEKGYMVYWDLDKNIGVKHENIYSNETLKFPTFITTTENAFVAFINANELVDGLDVYRKWKHTNIDEVSHTLYEDNPIIAFYYITKEISK